MAGGCLAQNYTLKMLDTSGYRPDGVLSSLVTLCQLRHYFAGVDDGINDCGDDLEPLSDLYPIAMGNTLALGDYVGCLTDGGGQHCGVKLVPFDSKSSKLENGTFGGGWVEHLLSGIPEELLPTFHSVIQTHLGICVPTDCTTSDIKAAYDEVFAGLGAEAQIAWCESAKSEAAARKLDTAGYAAVAVFSVIGLLIFIGTAIETYRRIYIPNSTKPSLMTKCLLCFSLGANLRRLMRTDNFVGTDFIGCFNGMRVLSLLWIIYSHIMPNSLIINDLEMNQFYSGKGDVGGYMNELKLDPLPPVATFFFMSGLLVAYNALIDLERGRFSLPMFYIHRYLRLTAPIALLVLFNVGLMYHLSHGPLWSSFSAYFAPFCINNGWTNVLYLNNLVANNQQCVGHTWYLACDMQMFVLSPLVILPLYKYGHWGIKWWAAALLVCTIPPMALTIANDLPPWVIDTATSNPNFDKGSQYYVQAYTWGQPYLVGIIVGFVFWKQRGKRIKLHWCTSLTLWLTSFCVGWTVVFGLWHARSPNYPYRPGYSAFEAAIYNGLSKLGWAAAMAWVTLACAKVNPGCLVDRLLSWGFFQPLAKLSYVGYLIHLELIYIYTNSRTYPVVVSYWTVIYNSCGIALLTLASSVPMTLVTEMPFVALEKTLLTRRRSTEK